MCYWAVPEENSYIVYGPDHDRNVRERHSSSKSMASLRGTYPDHFSWSDVNGTNYISPVQNQNIPQKCNSGWSVVLFPVVHWPLIFVDFDVSFRGGSGRLQCYQ